MSALRGCLSEGILLKSRFTSVSGYKERIRISINVIIILYAKGLYARQVLLYVSLKSFQRMKLVSDAYELRKRHIDMCCMRLNADIL